MSKTIDQKVVEMQFDNAQFEKNVSTSMSTLEKLKQSLNFDGASKSFENIERAANNVSFEKIASGVEALENRFSTMGIAGMRVIGNMTDAMIGFVKKGINFVTDSVIQGGKKRATNLENAHFQLQGLLKDEAAVQAIMKNVNDSVDGTAYSLDAAAKVASQYAATGMRAGDKMFSALRAVAGVAAMTNSEYEETGEIFTTVAGNGRLMGEQLNQLASRGLNAAATLATYLNKSESEVREMVSKGKISFETFAAAMDDAFGEHAKKANETFTGALSNVKAALARIGALFISPLIEQNGAFVKLFNTLREKINDIKSAMIPIADSVTKTVMNMANKLSGFIAKIDAKMLIESLKNSFEGLMSIIKPIKEAFKEIFPPITAQQLNKIIERIRDLTAKFKLNDKQSAKLKSTFKGLFSVIKLGVSVVTKIVSAVATLVGKLFGFSGSILDITGSLGDFISRIATSISKSNLFGKSVDKITGFLGKAIDKTKEFTEAITNKIKLPNYFDKFVNVIKKIGEVISKVAKKVSSAASGIGKAIWDIFLNGGLDNLVGLVNGGIFTSFLLDLKEFTEGLKKFNKEAKKEAKNSGGIKDSIVKVLNSVKESLEEWQKNIKAGTILKIAIAVAVLAAALLIISKVPVEKLGTSLGAVTALFGETLGALALFEKITGDYNGAFEAVAIIVAMSVSLLILASAVKKLSDLGLEGLAEGVIGISALMYALVGAAKLMSKGGKDISKGAYQLVIMAVALKIMASVCKDLSKLSLEDLGKGVSSIAVILLEFAGFAALMQLIDTDELMRSSFSLILIGVAMEIFADACAKFGNMEWVDLGKAGAAIAGILLIASGFGKLSQYSGDIKNSSIALILIGVAMEIFADVCTKFGQLEWEQLAKAGAAIAGILMLVNDFNSISEESGDDIIKSAISLAIIGVALEILQDALGKMGNISWEEYGKQMAVLGGSLAILSIAIRAMKDSIEGAAALIITSVALTILAGALAILGAMSWGSIIKGLVAIAGTLAILGVAGYLLEPLVPVIVALAGAVALFGLGCLAAGAGVVILSAGLTALSGTLVAAATGIISALTIIVVGILKIIPSIIEVLTDTIVVICEVITRSASAIGKALKTLILVLVDVIVECVPAIALGALKLILGVLESLAKYTPQIIDLLFKFLIGVLEGVAKNLPQLIQAAVDVFMSFFSGVVEALKKIDKETLIKGIAAVGILAALMTALAATALLAPAAMIGVFAMGTIVAELAFVLATLGGLAQIPGLEWFISQGGNLLQKIGTAIGQFIGGLIGGISKGIASSLPEIATDLSKFMVNLTPFIVGAKMIDASVLENVGTLAKVILLLTAADIVNGIASFISGGSSLAGFAEQLVPFGEGMKKYAAAVSGINASDIQASANAAKYISDVANAIPKSGGLAQLIFGGNDLGDFATKLTDFGSALKGYGEAVTGLNVEGIANSVIVAKGLSDVANALPETGVMQTLFGSKNISSFGDKIAKFGESMKKYSESVSGINATSIIASATAFKSLVSLAKESEGVDFGNLKSLGKNLKSISKSAVDKFISAFSDSSSKVSSAGSKMTDSFIKGVESKESLLVGVGKNMASKFASGISQNTKAIKDSFSAVLKAAISLIKSYYSQFREAGKYAVDGFADGISANTYKARAKAKAMADAASEAARKALDERSPSKVFYGIGDYAGVAFVNALKDHTTKAYKASFEMASKAKSGLSDAVAKISDVINSDIDAQPTIRPVLDLSDVRAGASSISRMFGANPSVGVMSNVRAITSMMNGNQNGGNDDVISAIKDLGNKISGKTGDTYQINGITYNDDSNVSDAVATLVRAVRVERRR
jgi:tape measure domain-containing protein